MVWWWHGIAWHGGFSRSVIGVVDGSLSDSG